jgi:hypothetical protein
MTQKMKKCANSANVEDQNDHLGTVTEGSDRAVVICSTPPTVKIVLPQERSHDPRSAMTLAMQ